MEYLNLKQLTKERREDFKAISINSSALTMRVLYYVYMNSL